jgi:hypothetical protein
MASPPAPSHRQGIGRLQADAASRMHEAMRERRRKSTTCRSKKRQAGNARELHSRQTRGNCTRAGSHAPCAYTSREEVPPSIHTNWERIRGRMKERREGKRRGNLELVEPDPWRPACGRVDSATLCLSANLRMPVTLLLPFSLKSAPSAQVFPSLCYVTCVSSALVLVCVWLGLACLILQLDGLRKLVFLMHYLLSYIL